MNTSLLQIVLYPLFVSLIITIITTPISLFFLRKFGIFDDPKKHKHPAIVHNKPIPRGGGIPLYLGVFIAGVIFLPVTKITLALFLASFLALAIGVLDDKLDVSPYLRFVINILTAIIIVNSGVTIDFITNPLGGIFHFNTVQLSLLGISTTLLGSVIAIIWIVWVMNMLNWSKGVDGQMPGIVAISAIIIGILSLRFPLSDQNTYIAALLSFMIAGSCIGFLFFNFYPAKIFPGYGATALYLLLAAVSILSSVKLATAVIVMGVPMIDGFFTIIRRILTGHSPFWHDNKHLHHMLLRLGLGQRTIALFYWLVSAILGVLALSLSSREKLFVIITILIIVGGALFFLHFAINADDEKQRFYHS